MIQTNDHDGNFVGLVVGALLGAAVGAGIALLCAPRSGKETRGLLAGKTRQLKNRTSNAFEQGKHAIRREAKAMTAELKEAAKAL